LNLRRHRWGASFYIIETRGVSNINLTLRIKNSKLTQCLYNGISLPPSGILYIRIPGGGFFVVILLKSVCLIIWLAIMLALMGSNQRGQACSYREVALYLNDEDDLEGIIEQKISQLGPRDRLIIHDRGQAGVRQRVVIQRLLRKNPSVVYYQSIPEL